MAVRGTEDSGGNNSNSDINTNVSAPGPTSGPDVFSLLNTFQSASTLGEGVNTYITKVKEEIAKSEHEVSKQIKVIRLHEPNGAHAFIGPDNLAVGVLFSELLPTELKDFRPLSDYGRYLEENLRKTVQGVKFLNMVLIDQYDYTRYVQMAQDLIRTFITAADPAMRAVTITAFNRTQCVVEHDAAAARNIIQQLSPHATMPRTDLGFVFYARAPRHSNFDQQNNVDNLKPIMAVGGYTEIVEDRINRQPNGAATYIPVVHITSIQPILGPIPGLIPLAIGLAADQWLDGPGRQSRWRSQFNDFGKSRPNLGRLAVDPNSKNGGLGFCADQQQRDMFIAQCFKPAVLSIDVVDGQARMPSMALYGSGNTQGIIKQLKHFFGEQYPVVSSAPFCQVDSVDYIGTFGEVAGTRSDSRYVDYLSLTADRGALDQEASKLLGHYADPTIRVSVVAERAPGFRSLYRNSNVVLTAQHAQTLCDFIRQNLQITSSQSSNLPLQTDFLSAQATWYGANSFNATSGFQNNRNANWIGNFYIPS